MARLATFRFALVTVVTLVSSRPACAQLVVIVHKSNPAANLGLEELRRLYTGRVTAFPDGRPAVLGEYRPARRTFYRLALQHTETAMSRLWISLVFAGQNVTPPRTLSDAGGVLEFVASTPGAICFLDLQAVDASVKVLTIDGHGPRDPGYVLR